MVKVIILTISLGLLGCTTHTQLGSKSPVSTDVIYLNNASSPVRVIFSLKDLNGRQYEVLGAITASGSYRKTTDNMLMESLKRQAVNMGANVLLFEGFSNTLPSGYKKTGDPWNDAGRSLGQVAETLMAKAYAKGYALKVR